MQKLEKRLIVILVSLVFVISGLTVSSENIQEKTQISTLTKTVTIYRYGIDGKVLPFDINLFLENGKDIEEAISEKCDELLQNDQEIQSYLKISNNSFGMLCKVKSRGKGFHYQMVLLGKLVIRYILFRLGLPRIHTLLSKPVILCKYPKDPKANTTITSLLFNRTTPMEGNHSVMVFNFIGYTTWCRRFSFTPFNFIPRLFVGYAQFVVCKKLP